MFPTWSDWDIIYTRKGAIKRGISKVLKILFVLGLARLLIASRGDWGLKKLLRNRYVMALLQKRGVGV